jgi:hypothetical protein
MSLAPLHTGPAQDHFKPLIPSHNTGAFFLDDEGSTGTECGTDRALGLISKCKRQ